MKPGGEDQAWAEEVSDTAAVQSNSAEGKGSPLASKQLLRERGRPRPRLLLFARALINDQADLEHSQLCFKA